MQQTLDMHACCEAWGLHVMLLLPSEGLNTRTHHHQSAGTAGLAMSFH